MHYRFTVGDILNQTDIRNRKQEHRARDCAYNRLIPLDRIIDAHSAHAKGRHEIAEYLGVTEEFLQNTINRYLDKYGIFVEYNKYLILLEPLLIIEPYEY